MNELQGITSRYGNIPEMLSTKEGLPSHQENSTEMSDYLQTQLAVTHSQAKEEVYETWDAT